MPNSEIANRGVILRWPGELNSGSLSNQGLNPADFPASHDYPTRVVDERGAEFDVIFSVDDQGNVSKELTPAKGLWSPVNAPSRFSPDLHLLPFHPDWPQAVLDLLPDPRIVYRREALESPQELYDSEFDITVDSGSFSEGDRVQGASSGAIYTIINVPTSGTWQLSQNTSATATQGETLDKIDSGGNTTGDSATLDTVQYEELVLHAWTVRETKDISPMQLYGRLWGDLSNVQGDTVVELRRSGSQDQSGAFQSESTLKTVTIPNDGQFSYSGILVTWTHSGETPDHFEVEYRQVGGTYSTATNGGNISGDARDFVIDQADLSDSATYEVRVIAVFSNGTEKTSDDSNDVDTPDTSSSGVNRQTSTSISGTTFQKGDLLTLVLTRAGRGRELELEVRN